MNTKFLNELREKLGVGLSEAMRLLKENGEDFENVKKPFTMKKLPKSSQPPSANPTKPKRVFSDFMMWKKPLNP